MYGDPSGSYPGRIDFHNNLAFDNAVNFNMLADAGFPSSHELRNNVAMTPGTAIANLSGGTDSSNSWSLSVTVGTADFVSLDPADARAPREPDGSLPNAGFGRLANGSDLIDAGVDVGLPFTGDAPDLGAFEAGDTSGNPPGTGGTRDGGAATAGAAGRGGTSSGASSGTSLGGASRGGTSAGGASAGGASAGGTRTMGGFNAAGGTANASGRAPAASGGTTSASAGTGASSGGTAAARSDGGSSGRAAGSGGSSNGTPGGAPAIEAPREEAASSCACSVPGRARSAGVPASLALLGFALGRGLRRRRSRAARAT